MIARLSGYDEAKDALDKLSKEAGHRAAIRALAAQVRDPVVVNALLWAAAEGEKKKA